MREEIGELIWCYFDWFSVLYLYLHTLAINWPPVPPLLLQCCLNEMLLSLLWHLYERDEQAKGLIKAAEALTWVLSRWVGKETATKVQGSLKVMATEEGEVWSVCKGREDNWNGACALLEEESVGRWALRLECSWAWDQSSAILCFLSFLYP